jgi:hypothetical protein
MISLGTSGSVRKYLQADKQKPSDKWSVIWGAYIFIIRIREHAQ